jgi:hypothetical protein
VVASRPAGKPVNIVSFPQQVLQQHFSIEPVRLVWRTITGEEKKKKKEVKLDAG